MCFNEIWEVDAILLIFWGEMMQNLIRAKVVWLAIILTGIGLFSANAYAQTNSGSQVNHDDFWGAKLRDHATRYKRPDEDSFVSTMMAVCKSRDPNVKKLGKFEENYFSDPSILDGKLQANILYSSDKVVIPSREFGEQPETFFVPKKAPLFVYFPGAFSHINNDQTNRFFKDMNRLGYHVATFNSPLHKNFIKTKPNFKPGDFMKEAQVLHRGLQYVVDHIKGQGLLESDLVYLTGVSYGAFMSAMVTNFDFDSRNLITGGTTLISPPADYERSIQIIDDLIDETRADFAGLSMSTKYSRYLTVCKRHSKRLLKKYAKGLTIFVGFQENMVKSVKAYRKAYGIKDTPYNDPKWKENLTFQNYFDWYAPELNADYQSKNSKLKTWVDRANAKGKIMRIFAAEDDWLNEPTAWDHYDPENLLTVHKGGHYGFHHLQWYDTLLSTLFTLPLAILGGVIAL